MRYFCVAYCNVKAIFAGFSLICLESLGFLKYWQEQRSSSPSKSGSDQSSSETESTFDSADSESDAWDFYSVLAKPIS